MQRRDPGAGRAPDRGGAGARRWRPDGDLLRDVQALLESLRPDVDPAAIQVRVAGGVVELAGFVERRSTAVLLADRARRLDGVVGVDARVDFHLDDWTPVHEGDPYRAIPLRMEAGMRPAPSGTSPRR